MIDPHAYNITVRRAIFEGENCFEARVKELPDLAEYGDSFEEAYALAIDSIQTTYDVFSEKGKAMPEPYVVADDYSGRVTLRLPKSLHRAVVEASEDEGVSLNQHLVNVLVYYSGFASGAIRMGDPIDWITIGRTDAKKRQRTNIKLVYSVGVTENNLWHKKTG